MQLDFWFDLSCPYAYLASQRLERSLVGRVVTLRYKPMLLGGVFRATGAGDGPMGSLPPAKRQNLALDLMRWADLDGTPMQTPAAHPMRTVRALRTLLGLPEEKWPAAVNALYAAYWQRGEDITSDDVIEAALRRAGLDGAVILAALAGADSEARKDELRVRTDEAVALGIFGAPAFVVHTAAGPKLIWGQDRMMWVEALLDGWQPPAPPRDDPRRSDGAIATRRIDSREATRGGDECRGLALGRRGGKAPPALDFTFDVASPFAYLGLTQIARVARGHQLTLRPILLGGLFRAIGTADVPLFAFPEAKRRYVTGELALWSSWWQVPLAFPRKFPQRTQTVQRILLDAAATPELQLRLAIAFGRAMWADGQDLEDEAVVAAILAAEGGDGAALARSKEPAAKEALITATSEAAAAGVFGVPTCLVHDEKGPRRFWGQDRLGLVAAALGGWRADGEAALDGAPGPPPRSALSTRTGELAGT